jgi:hypothetical protein
MKRWLDYKGEEKFNYEVGDKVKILRQDIYHLQNVQGEKRWGTITEVITADVYIVRPRYCRWETELYYGEIEPHKKSRLMTYEEVMASK